MIVSGALTSAKQAEQPGKLESVPDQGGSPYTGRRWTKAKQVVSPELSKKIATVFACSNGISDDIANMPLQMFERADGVTRKIDPDALIRNMPYLLEISSNRWMTPFIFKKTGINWLLFWGNWLTWQPAPPAQRELFILPTNVTVPRLDRNGYLWYQVRFPNGEKKFIPAVEVMHVMINSTNGIWGRGVLEYASETAGLRLSQAATQSSIQGQGLNPSAYIQVNALLDDKGRQKYRDSYAEVMSGTDNAGNLAVFDNKVVKFEPVTMRAKDVEFLAGINATDVDLANFFNYPEYKLNRGKQSYESNEQQDLDYLKSTLDPYLVQIEQTGRLRWLPEAEQQTRYLKFVRESILRTNAKSRAELHEIKIRSGTMTPNESREVEDQNSYELGSKFYMTRNNAPVDELAVEGK